MKNEVKCDVCGEAICGIRFHRDLKSRKIICYKCSLPDCTDQQTEDEKIRDAFDRDYEAVWRIENLCGNYHYELYKSGYKAQLAKLKQQAEEIEELKKDLAIEALGMTKDYLCTESYTNKKCREVYDTVCTALSKIKEGRKVMKCETCKGLGYLQPPHSDICPGCNGSGIQHEITAKEISVISDPIRDKYEKEEGK